MLQCRSKRLIDPTTNKISMSYFASGPVSTTKALQRHLCFLGPAIQAAYRRLCIILGLHVSDLAGLNLFLSVQLLKINNELIGRTRLTDLPVLDLGDRGLRALDRSSDFRLRHAKPFEFENDVLDVHEHQL